MIGITVVTVFPRPCRLRSSSSFMLRVLFWTITRLFLGFCIYLGVSMKAHLEYGCCSYTLSSYNFTSHCHVHTHVYIYVYLFRSYGKLLTLLSPMQNFASNVSSLVSNWYLCVVPLIVAWTHNDSHCPVLLYFRIVLCSKLNLSPPQIILIFFSISLTEREIDSSHSSISYTRTPFKTL